VVRHGRGGRGGLRGRQPVAQAFTAATHCARTWLLCLLVVTAEGGLLLLLGFVVAVAVVMFAVYDLICFVALLRGVGVEEEEE
jgi:hypothetical protein